MSQFMRWLIATLVVALAFVGASASAQTTAGPTPSRAPAPTAIDPHTAQPERPTVATHAGTVAPGWLEIETGVELDRYDDMSKGGSAPTVFKIGLAPRLQLGIGTPLVRTPGARDYGLGDVSLGVKWRLVEDAPVLGDFAVLPSIKFPTGSSPKGLGTGTTDVGLLVISSHTIGDIAMDLNVGVVRRSGDGTGVPRTSTVWTASIGGPLRGALGFAAEIYGYPATSGPAGADQIVAALAGPTWTARGWLVFDAGIIVKLTGAQPAALYAGMTWNVGGPKNK
jgi:hypothetical protein